MMTSVTSTERSSTPAEIADLTPLKRRSTIKDWVGLLARLILGGALVVAGALKIGSLEYSVDSVRAYQILPWDVAKWVGYGLPIVEFILGAMILAGFLTRWTALLGTLMMLAFVIGIISVWARGINIDCGCFGDGGAVAAGETQYPLDIARDVLFMAAGVWLVIRPRSKFAVDNLLLAGLGHPDYLADDVDDDDLDDDFAVADRRRIH